MGCNCGKNRPRLAMNNNSPRNPSIQINVSQPQPQQPMIRVSAQSLPPNPIPTSSTLSPTGLDAHRRRIEQLKRVEVYKRKFSH